jgi:hypothetical protein
MRYLQHTVLLLTKDKIKCLEGRATMKRLRLRPAFVAMFILSGWIFALMPVGADSGAEVDPAKYDFGDVKLGASTSAIITISNTGMDRFFISEIGFEAGSSPDYSITSSALGEVLDPGELLKVEVTYTPSAIGNASALLRILWVDRESGLEQVSLLGRGVN